MAWPAVSVHVITNMVKKKEKDMNIPQAKHTTIEI